MGSKEKVEKAEELCSEVGRMLGGVMKALRAKS
jgi:hypothetical protein